MATQRKTRAPKLPTATAAAPAPAASEPKPAAAAQPKVAKLPKAPKPAAKSSDQPAAKPSAKPTPAASPAPAASAPAKASKKPVKARPVLVRDSFTMPEVDFALIAQLKTTALGAQRAAKKSELLRAGLQLLAGLSAESLVLALDRLEAVKTGRPKKGH